MLYVMLAPGFEEIEALTTVDILRRAGLPVVTLGVGGVNITGAHDITVLADMPAEEAGDDAELLFLPGGMPGAENLHRCPETDRLIDAVLRHGGHLAAICAAPMILGWRGLLAGKKATCYPGFEQELTGALIQKGARVVTDGNITTGLGMGAATEFALELLRILTDSDCAGRIASSIRCAR